MALICRLFTTASRNRNADRRSPTSAMSPTVVTVLTIGTFALVSTPPPPV
ncbi:hypothetical protein ACFSTC_58295 [Nonomuraea ferruginea]